MGELEDLKNKVEELEEEKKELEIMFANTLDHGTALENDLADQNAKITAIRDNMKKYLSPQLYEHLLGDGDSSIVRKQDRKKLTVFFSDIVGFSVITDSIESEVLSDLLNGYLHIMANIALKYGGTIDKFIGDAVMVFFGDPVFVDDKTHALNCVMMAIEMRNAVFDISKKWKEAGISEPFQIRMGINTGFCTVGNFGSEDRLDYTIVGGQVNIASRLEGIAPPNSIYVSSTTYNLIKDDIVCDYVNSMQVKGVHHPIEVYEVLYKKGTFADVSKTYIEERENGFFIDNLSFDGLKSSKVEILRLRNSLEKALSIIGKYEKPKEYFRKTQNGFELKDVLFENDMNTKDIKSIRNALNRAISTIDS